MQGGASRTDTPDPTGLYPKIIATLANTVLREEQISYDPTFARRIPPLLNSFPNLRVMTFSQSFSLFSPLSPEEREYVRGNAAILVQAAIQRGASPEIEAWFETFQESNPHSVFSRDDFMYSMTEFGFQAMVT